MPRMLKLRPSNQTVRVNKGVEIVADDKSLLQKTITLATALLTGETVSQDVLAKRIEICSECDKVIKKGDVMRCGICGCKIKGDKSLVNLARFVETDRYGCKYKGGSKWKKAGA